MMKWKLFRLIRIMAVIAAVALGAVIIALAIWGTERQLGTASAHDAGYELVGVWDGKDVPSGGIQRPMGIAVAPGGDVYVTSGKTTVLHLNSEGEYLGTWGNPGNSPGEFSNAFALAVAANGAVYVSDYDLDRIQKFTPDGNHVETIARPGRLGPGALHYPTDATFTRDGNLLVADAYNYRLQWFDASGRTFRRAGRHRFWLWPQPAAGTRGFNVPSGVAVGPGGSIHVADSANHRIVMLSASTEYVTEWKLPDAESGVHSPAKVALSPDGKTLYATDLPRNRILVMKVTPPENP